MFSHVRRQALIALSLMAFLVFGAAAAEAHDTNDSDRLVKGAAIGAAVGAVTQAVRGRTTGGELLKGAAVGGAIGAAVGAYSDYRQEKRAVRDHHRADYYPYSRGYRGGYYGHGRADRARSLRYSGDFRNAPYYDQNGRGHKHGKRCRH